ncbi:mannosyltransferase [Tamlana fucoidanivorans]|nr:mannosyltransferase [Tamlana fucoidanivorans]
MAFGFRVIFIVAIPNLSQDFFRFIWDGRMILEGYNPYLYTVQSFFDNGQLPIHQAEALRHGMGDLNASHFTNYPPVNQLCFAVAALWSSKSILGSVVIMRLLIISADFGTLFFGQKLLKQLKMPSYYIFWYILNPFIIIELTGNLHFEGVMIFFLVWSLYLLHIRKWYWAAVTLALSISVKLIPLIFLPLFLQWFINLYGIKPGIKRLIAFYGLVLLCTLSLFVPFYSSKFVHNYTQTVALWFQNFEFNASLYYIARELGYKFRGYNEIEIIGKVIPVLVLAVTLTITFLRNNKTTARLITAMLMVLTLYYFMATTVHPWYIATLLILAVFTKYKFPLVWSGVIILSYLAYLNLNKPDKSENFVIIALEYLLVYGVFIWDIFIKKAPKTGA